MIIECESCKTRFRLDETRIPPEGARVRCSRCKTAFFVEPPSDPAPEGTDEVVGEATDPPQAADGAAGQDLFGAGGADLGHAAAAEASSSQPDPEPEQWEFEDEVEPEAPAPTPPPPPPPVAAAAPPEPEALEIDFPEPEPAQPDPMDDFALDMGDSGLDLADGSDRASEPARAPVPDPIPESVPEPVPAPIPEPIPELASEPAPEQTSGSGLEMGLESDETGLEPIPSPDVAEPPSAPAPAPVVAAEPSGEPFGELGSPEDWDFLADSSEALAQTAEFTEDADGGAAAAAPSPAADLDDRDLFPEDAPPAVMADSAPDAPRFARLSFGATGNAIGWLGGVALLVIGISQALMPAPPRGLSVAEPRTFSLEIGEAREVRGGFIDNAWAGPLFVVQGHYEPSERPRGPVKLVLRWLDAEGRPLAGAEDAMAGAGLEPEALRELRPGAASEFLAEASPDFEFGGSFNVVPGSVPDGAVDFDLVFEGIPAPPAPPAEVAASEDVLEPGEEALEREEAD